MKKLLFVLLAAGAVGVSSCDWWDPYPDPPDDPWDPPTDTIKPWDPRDTSGGGNPGDTIIIIDPWDPTDSNWWDPRDTN